MNKQQKLKILLEHWIEHNEQHTKQYREWSEKTSEAAQSLKEAVIYSDSIDEALKKALSELGH